MSKTPDAFRTISEVAEELDLPQHVLRFWETKFAQIKPLKRPGGRRYYRTDDVALVATIKGLLYGQGYTIKGVQRILKENGVRAVVAAAAGGPPLGQAALPPAPDATPQIDAVAAPAPAAAAGRGDLAALAAELSECARILRAAAG